MFIFEALQTAVVHIGLDFLDGLGRLAKNIAYDSYVYFEITSRALQNGCLTHITVYNNIVF